MSDCPECNGTTILGVDGYYCTECFILTGDPVFDVVVSSEFSKAPENLSNYAHKRLNGLMDEIPNDLQTKVMEIYEHLKTVHTGENDKRKNFYKSKQLLKSILLNLGRKDIADKFSEIKNKEKRLEVHEFVTKNMRKWLGLFDYCESLGWVVNQTIVDYVEPKSVYKGIYTDIRKKAFLD